MSNQQSNWKVQAVQDEILDYDEDELMEVAEEARVASNEGVVNLGNPQEVPADETVPMLITLKPDSGCTASLLKAIDDLKEPELKRRLKAAIFPIYKV